MLIKIKYPLLIKYWSIFFFFKLNLIPFSIKLKFYSQKIILDIFIYIKNSFSFKEKEKNSIIYTFYKLKLKLVQLQLQHRLSFLFPNKLKIYIKNVFNLLNYKYYSYNRYLCNYIKKSKQLKVNNLNNLVNTITLCFFFKAPFIFIEFLINFFSTLKNHKSFFFILKRLLKEYIRLLSSKILGFQLQIKGKINGVTRTKTYLIKEGKLNFTSKSAHILYAFNSCVTSTGLFGFKFWLHY